MSTAGSDDAELVAAVAAGDRRALKTLYDRHAPWLMLRLLRRCNDPWVVDEALQDTFVAVWRTAARYSHKGTVPAWLWGIAIRRLIDQLRGQERRRRPLRGRAQSAPSAEEQALTQVEYSDLGGALDRLSPELLAVVQATVLDGLSTTEAARLLGVPAGTIKTRMMRARMQLRGELA